MAKSTPWEMQRSVEPVSKKNMGVLVLHELLHLVYWIWISCEGIACGGLTEMEILRTYGESFLTVNRGGSPDPDFHYHHSHRQVEIKDIIADRVFKSLMVNFVARLL
jgi:hypothetical protein